MTFIRKLKDGKSHCSDTYYLFKVNNDTNPGSHRDYGECGLAVDANGNPVSDYSMTGSLGAA